tara:strand:- start:4581 stop:5273 length:693 start_codon:yes stop_codon:yes gene_type:complete
MRFNSLEDEIELFSSSNNLSVKVESFGKDSKLIIVDNFYKHPYKVRELCKSIPATFNPRIVHGLPGSRVEATYYFSHLGHLYNEIINHVFPEDMENVQLDFIQQCMDHATFLVNVQNSNMPPRVPHIDGINSGRWASGIYLNTPEECTGGTSFYTYKGEKTVDMSQINIADLQAYNYYVQDDNEEFKMIYLAEMKFNRMIIYRSNELHTPYIPPNTFTDEDPRLMQMFFL